MVIVRVKDSSKLGPMAWWGGGWRGAGVVMLGRAARHGLTRLGAHGQGRVCGVGKGVRSERHALDLALALEPRLGPCLAPRLALSECCASACTGRSNGIQRGRCVRASSSPTSPKTHHTKRPTRVGDGCVDDGWR